MTTDHFCVGSLTNASRNEKTESARKHIGHGIQLTYVGGELYVDCSSDHAVFIQSEIFARSLGLPSLSVMKLSPGHGAKVFTNQEFAKHLHESVAKGYNDTFKLTSTCSVYLSFIKGWGPDYHRQSVNCTPCWLEIQMYESLVWLDKVLLQIENTSRITSNS